MFTLAISNLAERQSKPVYPDLFFQADRQVYLTHGLHKLLSQAVFLLLTEEGSIAGAPSLGLNVVDQLGSVSLSEVAVVEQILSEITRDLSDQLLLITANSPDDERLAKVSLSTFDIVDENTLQVELSLSSIAGEAAVYNTTLITRTN